MSITMGVGGETVRNYSVQTVYTGTTLELKDCIASAREKNADLMHALSSIRNLKGESYVFHSRLLPHLSLLYGTGESANIDTSLTPYRTRYDHDQVLSLELRQRILEFGKTTEPELTRLRVKSAALYHSEYVTADVLSKIRQAYFSIRITDEQLRQHDSLFSSYNSRLDRANERLENGITWKTVQLAARLNSLEEQERILQLKTKRRSQATLLSELTGLGRIGENVRFTTKKNPFSLSEDSCSSLALDRNTEIANCEAEARLAQRQLHEWLWEFAPGVSLSAGLNRDNRTAGIELFKSDTGHEWAVDVVGTQDIQAANGALFPPRDTIMRCTAKIELTFPLFAGLKRYGTHMKADARYQSARADLIAKTRSVETDARTAAENYDLSRKTLELQKERVDIAKERYSLAETLHELGRISEDGFDNFRSQLFQAQDRFYEQQFEVITREERLRALVREFD